MKQITITMTLPEACTLLEWLYQRNSREDLPERCFSHFGEKAALWSLECLLEAALAAEAGTHRPQPDRPGPDAGLTAEGHGNSPI